jgi:YD repeat-containing protein
MFAFTPRKEIMIRLLLGVMILFSMVISQPVTQVQARQESIISTQPDSNRGLKLFNFAHSIHLNNDKTGLSSLENITQSIIIGGIDWILNWNADTTTVPGAVKLTSNIPNYVRGSAWSSQQIDLSQNFDITFNLYLGDHDSGADGIVFVLQNTGTSASAIGAAGYGIGYHGFPGASMAVEFDTYQNGYDPAQDHVALLKNGHIDQHITLVAAPDSFEDNQEHTFRFMWDSSAKNLRVIEYLPDGGGLEFVNYTEDFVQTVFGGNSNVWFGFTAATGAASNLQYFYPSSVISDQSTYSSDCAADSGISCTAQCTQGDVGGPINTRTGGYDYSATDISIQTSVGALTFERSYSSLTTDIYTSSLGYGWTHNQDVYLSIGAYDANDQRVITLKGRTANQYTFTQDLGFSTTIPEPGIYATLTEGATSFVLIDATQNQYEFDLTTGKLLSYSNVNDHTWDYIYDTNGRLERISADGGLRYLEVDYDAQERIIRVTDHTGRFVIYHYDTNGDLDYITDVLGETWTYEYHPVLAHMLTRAVAPDNMTIERTEYDLSGRAIRQFDGEDNLVAELIYNADGSTTVKDGLNNISTYTYDGRGTLISEENAVGGKQQKRYDVNFRQTAVANEAGHTLEMTWSADGVNLLSKTDPEGNQTDYTYDSLNNLTSTTDPLGNTTNYTYDGKLLTSSEDPLGGTTTYTYTPEGYLESVTDAAGRETTYTYDSFGQRTSMTDPSNNTWTYSYDSLGRLIDTTDPRGRKTHNEYNAAGKLVRVTQNYDSGRPQNDQNLYNIVTEYEYDVRGNQIAVTDTFGRTTQYVYDDADRLLQTIDSAGNTTSNTYDAAGRLVSTKDPLLNETTYEYDAAGRLIKTINALGFHSGITTFDVPTNTSTVTDILQRQTVFHYDELGRVIKVVDPLGNFTTTTYDANGNVATRTDQLNRTTTYEYDELNRLVRTIDPNNGITQTIYDPVTGYRTATIDPLGHQTTYTYDSVGRLIATTDPLNRVTQTVYDSYGRRSATIDAAGNETTYTYDLLDRIIAVTDAADNTTSTTYDALGNVLTRTDANGNATTTTYDVLYRPYITTDANNNSVTNSYDAAGNLISVTDALGNTITYTYNALNRRVSVKDPLNHTTYTSYDSLGNLLETTDANGVVTRYEYDALNRQTAVILNYQPGIQADAETNVRYEFAYNAVGNRTSVRDPNGNETLYGYDALNRVTSKSDPLENTWAYTYDLAGNRISATDAKGQTIQYTYDAAGQLTGIDYPGTEPDVTFSYDLTGQRISMTDGLGTTTWTYDNLNRPTSVNDALGKTISYDYDAVGNRTQLTYPDGKTVHVHLR